MLSSRFLLELTRHDASRRQGRKNLPLPRPLDFRKSIDGLAAPVELDIKVAVFDPVLFVFLNCGRNRVKILYWERNGFYLWFKRLDAERFKPHPEPGDEAIGLMAQELNWLLDGVDLWRNRPHQALPPALRDLSRGRGHPLVMVLDVDVPMAGAAARQLSG